MVAGRMATVLRTLTRTVSRIWGSLLLVSMTLLLGACGTDDESEPNLAVIRNGVQLVWVANTEAATTRGVNLLRESSRSRKGRATGNLILPQSTGVKYTCGVTFISHQYAITAAHCLDSGTTTLTTNFTVQQYDTTQLDLNAFSTQSRVSGTWPNFQRVNKLTAAQGYKKLPPQTCRLVRRCSYGRTGCPFTQDIDIALLRCSARSKTELNWVPVSTSNDSGTQNVDIWWFHEVVNLSTSATHIVPYAPANNWNNYGLYPANGDLTQNYHYWHSSVDTDHDLLPLISKQSANGVKYKGLGHEGSSITRMNIPVCHGTSGSGVFRSSADEVLGVVSNFGTVFERNGTTLCEDMTTSSLEQGSGYTQRQYAAAFQSLSEVSGDRQ